LTIELFIINKKIINKYTIYIIEKFSNYNNLNNFPEIENMISNEILNENNEKRNNDKDKFTINNQINNSYESTLKRKEDWNILYNFFQKK
jgi:predicted membrane-bound dolichyl-phosphate-mannose-protein mannosyltransferase